MKKEQLKYTVWVPLKRPVRSDYVEITACVINIIIAIQNAMRKGLWMDAYSKYTGIFYEL